MFAHAVHLTDVLYEVIDAGLQATPYSAVVHLFVMVAVEHEEHPTIQHKGRGHAAVIGHTG